MNKQECLVIDDLPSVQKLLDGMVTALGFKPLNALNGIEGLVSFEDHPTPLVVADAEMRGELDANQFAATIKYLNPATVVVLVTSDETSSQDEQASPADLILHKPFSLGSLQSALNPLFKG